jgi:Spy/CpxP family protein refolding chaperone
MLGNPEQERPMRHLGIIGIAVAFTLVFPTASGAEGTVSKYAGEETREIKSLSPDDIAELRRGGGWGMAKAAELNGVPVPAHLLEMKDEIPLTPDQIAALEAVYADMTEKAVAEAETLIALEAALDRNFADRTITDESLRAQLAEIAATRSALRYIHLSTHLKTPAILTEAQIARYNTLRGYGADDPCAAVPAGHDPVMWRQHNGCG